MCEDSTINCIIDMIFEPVFTQHKHKLNIEKQSEAQIRMPGSHND